MGQINSEVIWREPDLVFCPEHGKSVITYAVKIQRPGYRKMDEVQENGTSTFNYTLIYKSHS